MIPLLHGIYPSRPAGVVPDYIAFWTMDNISGSTVLDETNNNYDLTITGATSGVTGYIDDAMSFDGTGDKLAGSDGDFAFTRIDPFSVSFWFKFDSTPTAFKYFMGNMDDAAVGTDYGWYIRNGGVSDREKLAFYMRDNSNTMFVVTNTNVLTTSYRHYCLTYDGSSTGSGVTIYVDGSAVANGGGATLSGTMSGTQVFAIGEDNTGGIGDLDGDMDHVKIYDRELSASEVAQLAAET